MPNLKNILTKPIPKSKPKPIPKSKPKPIPKSKPKPIPKPKPKSIPKSIPKNKGGTLSNDIPLNISTIPEDLRLKILNNAFNFSDIDDNVLNNNYLSDYFKLMSNVSKINNSFRSAISSIRPSFKNINNINIINLHDLKITKAILDVLNMINVENIHTIVFHNISFDNNNTRNEFLEFFSKNIKVKNLIFDNVDVNSSQFLTILQTFNLLIWLEISRYKLSQDDYNIFKNVLLYLKYLKYLTLTHNTLWIEFFYNIFTKDKNNISYINNIPYIIYVSKEYKKWNIFIRENNTTLVNKFEVNIVNNKIYGSSNIIDLSIDFSNDFAENIKFIQ